MSNNSTFVSIRNLSKIYIAGKKKVVALNKLTLDIFEGEIFALIGPNGSGKTTFIKLLLSLAQPSSGTILMYGKSQLDNVFRSNIGYVPEEISLPEFKNPEMFLKYISILKGIKKEKVISEITRIIDEFDLKVHDKSIDTFSKGMKRRLSIAQAFLNHPKLLILDEPTDGLDYSQRRKVMERLLEFKRNGGTVLFCSHILSEIENMCDRFGFILNGKIINIGTKKDITNKAYIIKIKSPINTEIKDIFSNCLVVESKNISTIIVPNYELLLDIKLILSEHGIDIISIQHQIINLEILYKHYIKI